MKFNLKREVFQRPMRMTHAFGETLRQNDPLGRNAFDVPQPMVSQQRRGAYGVEVSNHGDHSYFEPRSAVVKPNGRTASINGPALDEATCIAQPIPVSTRKRSFPKSEV